MFEGVKFALYLKNRDLTHLCYGMGDGGCSGFL